MTAVCFARRQQARRRGSAELFGRVAGRSPAARPDGKHAPQHPFIVDKLLGGARRLTLEPLTVERRNDRGLRRAERRKRRTVLARDREHERKIPRGPAIGETNLHLKPSLERRTSAGALGCKRGIGKAGAAGLSPRFQGAIGKGEKANRACGAALGRTFVCWTALPLLLALSAAATAQPNQPPPPAPQPAPEPEQIIGFSADQVTYDSDADFGHRDGRSAHVARRQLSGRRPGRVGPQERPGPGPGQCRPGHSAGRQAGGRKCRPHRHPARRDDRQSAGRARKRRPDRRVARSPHRQRHHARKRDLLALPGDHPDRLPAPAELEHHRDAGDRRSGQPPRTLRRRAASAVRRQSAAVPGVRHRHRRPEG